MDPGKYKPFKPLHVVSRLYVYSYCPELPVQYLGNITAWGEP